MRVTTAAALAGAADTLTFAITRRDVLSAKPVRAAGVAATLVLWSALVQSSATGARSRARRLAAIALAANGAMLGAHLKARIPNPRIYGGAALAAAALAGTFLRD